MKSKTSLFNTALLKKNLQRFWPAALVYFLYLFFSMPFAAYTQLQDWDSHHDRLLVLTEIAGFGAHTVIIMLFAFVTALLVFSYLYQSRSGYMMHAFPITREEQFRTNVVSGLLLMFIPQLAAALLLMPALISERLPLLFPVWLLYAFGTSLVFFSIAALSCHLSGHAFATMVYYVFFLAVYPAVRAIVLLVVSAFGYGMQNVYMDHPIESSPLSPVSFLMLHCRITPAENDAGNITGFSFAGGWKLALFAVAAIVILYISLLLYRRRQIECAGEMSAFAFIRPVIRWTITYGVPAGFALLICELISHNSFALFLILYVIIAIFCFIFTEMVLKKSSRIFTKKMMTECAACIIIFAALFCAINFDTFHVQRRIPEADEIATASVNGLYTIRDSDAYTIEAIRQIHGDLIENQKEYTDYMKEVRREQEFGTAPSSYASVRILYRLKNGRTLRRYYDLPLSESTFADRSSAVTLIDQLESDPERLIEYRLPEFENGTLQDGYINENFVDAAGAKLVAEAWMKDAREGNLGYHLKRIEEINQSGYYYVDISYLVPVTFFGPEATDGEGRLYEIDGCSINLSATDDQMYEIYATLPINGSCSHTIQALIDCGAFRSVEDLDLTDAPDKLNAYVN